MQRDYRNEAARRRLENSMQIVWGIVILVLVITASFGPLALLWLFVGSFAVFMAASVVLLVAERRRR